MPRPSATPIRAVFMGNDAWSVPTLERLARDDGVDVVLVVTNPPRPAGRGSSLTPTPVADAARRLSLPLDETETTRDDRFVAQLRALDPDVSVVVAYGELLAGDVLDAPRLGSVNLHFSLLPRWRGASPVQHAILEGDAVTGITVMRMDEGMDTGPVLARREEAIRSDDDAGSLGRAAREDRRRGGRGGAAASRGRHRDADAAGRHRHAGTQARARRPDRRLDATRGRRRASRACVRARSGREHHVQGDRPQAAPRGGDEARRRTRPGRSSASTGKGSSWRRGTGACDCSRSRRPAGAGCRPRIGRAAFAI